MMTAEAKVYDNVEQPYAPIHKPRGVELLQWTNGAPYPSEALPYFVLELQ